VILDVFPKVRGHRRVQRKLGVPLEPGRDGEGLLSRADLTLDPSTRRVKRGTRDIELSAREFALLDYLMRNAGRDLSRAMIAEQVWGLDFDYGTNVVDVYINYLRNKIDRGQQRKLIQTVRGVGYRLSDETTAGGLPPSR